MAEEVHAQMRPHLEHRTSQTIIDLTEDADDRAPVPRHGRERARRPPQLGRSDSLALGELVDLGDVIDLTEDIPDLDVQFTREVQLPPAPAPARRPRVYEQPPPAHPRRIHAPHYNAAGHRFPQIFERPLEALAYYTMHPRGIPQRIGRGGMYDDENMDDWPEPQLHNFEPIPMPHDMAYHANAFDNRNIGKPEHEPPKKAADGFTRSPGKKDVVICPCCEEELIHKADAEEPVVKKGNKPPTKKEREVHPFWVLKECGHVSRLHSKTLICLTPYQVYCNSCYQARVPTPKGTRKAFREINKPGPSGKKAVKTFLCAVDDCESEVRSKERWVGVFL